MDVPSIQPLAGLYTMPVIMESTAQTARASNILSFKASLRLSKKGVLCGTGAVFSPKLYCKKMLKSVII